MMKNCNENLGGNETELPLWDTEVRCYIINVGRCRQTPLSVIFGIRVLACAQDSLYDYSSP